MCIGAYELCQLVRNKFSFLSTDVAAMPDIVLGSTSKVFNPLPLLSLDSETASHVLDLVRLRGMKKYGTTHKQT